MQVEPTAWKGKDRMATIRGLIIPVDWDDQGNITAVAILAPFEEEYSVELDARGEELLAFVRERVKASGLVRLDEHGQKILTIASYELLD